MNTRDLFMRHIESPLIRFLVWLNDRLLSLNERIARFKQRRGL